MFLAVRGCSRLLIVRTLESSLYTIGISDVQPNQSQFSAQVYTIVMLITQFYDDFAQRRSIADWEIRYSVRLFYIALTRCAVAVKLVDRVTGFAVVVTPTNTIAIDTYKVVRIEAHLELCNVLAKRRQLRLEPQGSDETAIRVGW